jgi:hypothetical protein
MEVIAMLSGVSRQASPGQGTAAAALQAARELYERDQRRGLARLNELFRSGVPPASPLDGRYAGTLVALDLAPGLTALAQAIASRWMPWQGKTFAAAEQRGDNIFTRDSLLLAHVYWPLYRGYQADGPATYRAFAFRTYLGPGRADPDRQVLKIDYNPPDNPRLSVRRVLDELVQLDDRLYLGKAHLKWWWGRWQTVACFTLSR